MVKRKKIVKRYVVTGGAGFIGSCLAKKLCEAGHDVHVFDDLSTGFKRNIPRQAIFHQIDVSRPDLLKKVTIKPGIDVVYHLAGQSSGENSFQDPLHDLDANFRSTYMMLEWAKQHQAKHFIYASSMSVYGQPDLDNPVVSEKDDCFPVSYYGVHKLASEKTIKIFERQHHLPTTSFRLFNVYGPGQNMDNMKQGMVSIYMAYLMRQQPICVKGSLGRFRDFIYIDDVVDALLRVQNKKATFGQAINLGTGKKTTVKDLLTLLLDVYQKKDFKKWVSVKGSTSGDITGCVADPSRLAKLLGWKSTVGLKEGIQRMKEWVDSTTDFWSVT